MGVPMIPALADRLEKLLQDFCASNIPFDISSDTNGIIILISGTPHRLGTRKRFKIGDMDGMVQFMHTEAQRLYPQSPYCEWARRMEKDKS